MFSKIWIISRLVDNLERGSRGQGFKDSSEVLNSYKELKVWQKSYQPCLKFKKQGKCFPKLRALV